jgi:hypothetical protein
LADLKTLFTHGHSAAVTTLSVSTAGRLGLDRRTSTCIEIAGYLQDVGRIGISNRIWAKPGPSGSRGTRSSTAVNGLFLHGFRPRGWWSFTISRAAEPLRAWNGRRGGAEHC